MHEVRVLRRPDERYKRAAFAQQLYFVGAGAAYFEDNVGARPQTGGIGDDLGARCAIYIVAEIGGISGARFDGHLEAKLDQFLDNFGYRGYAFFSRGDLFWYPNNLRHESPLCITNGS